MSSRVREYVERYRNRLDSLIIGVSPEDIIDTLSNADPTKNNRYLEWIIKQFISGRILLEDVDQVRVDLSQFIKNAKRIPQESRDINKFDYDTLKDFLDDNFNPKVNFNESISEDENVRVLYDGPLGILSVPLTERGSCQLGRGTRWCTSGKEGNMFETYNKKGPLYIFIDRQRGGEKIQFHLETSSIMNSRDSKLSQDLIDHYRIDNPVTSPIFKTYEESIMGDLRKIMPYVTEIIGGRWYEVEHIISTNARYAYEYTRDIIRDRWPEAEGLILESPRYSYLYARDIIRDRWPEAEEGIINSPFVVEYSRCHMQRRWLEAEHIISNNPKYSYFYSLCNIQGPWVQGEEAISRDPEWSYLYARYIIKNRWVQGEEAISRDPEWSYLYARDIIKNRWVQGEEAISRDPEWSYLYARYINR